jgi:MFS family permease
MGVGYGGVTALRPALIRQYFGRGRFGSVFGLVVGINAAGGIIGPPLAGWSYDTWGDYRVVWLAFSALSLAAAGLVLASRRHMPERRPTVA